MLITLIFDMEHTIYDPYTDQWCSIESIDKIVMFVKTSTFKYLFLKRASKMDMTSRYVSINLENRSIHLGNKSVCINDRISELRFATLSEQMYFYNVLNKEKIEL